MFTNTYRYAEFSTVNNFYNIAVKNEINYDEIIELASLNYPRLQNMPSKGFVGPGGPVGSVLADTFFCSQGMWSNKNRQCREFV